MAIAHKKTTDNCIKPRAQITKPLCSIAKNTNSDIKDIISNLKKYRRAPSIYPQQNKKGYCRKNSRPLSVPKSNLNQSRSRPKYPFADRTTQNKLKITSYAPIGKQIKNNNSSSFDYSINKEVSRYIGTHSKRNLNDSKITLGLYKMKYPNSVNEQHSPQYDNKRIKTKIEFKAIESESNIGEHQVDYIHARDTTKSSENSITTKVVNDFSSLPGASVASFISQVDKLLKNQEGLSVEDIHSCFVEFYQKEKTMLNQIEKIENKECEESIIPVKDSDNENDSIQT